MSIVVMLSDLKPQAQEEILNLLTDVKKRMLFRDGKIDFYVGEVVDEAELLDFEMIINDSEVV